MINSFLIVRDVAILSAFDRGRHNNLLHEVDVVSASFSISVASGALMLRTCRLAHLSVGLSVCLESVLWQNG